MAEGTKSSNEMWRLLFLCLTHCREGCLRLCLSMTAPHPLTPPPALPTTPNISILHPELERASQFCAFSHHTYTTRWFWRRELFPFAVCRTWLINTCFHAAILRAAAWKQCPDVHGAQSSWAVPEQASSGTLGFSMLNTNWPNEPWASMDGGCNISHWDKVCIRTYVIGLFDNWKDFATKKLFR